MSLAGRKYISLVDTSAGLFLELGKWLLNPPRSIAGLAALIIGYRVWRYRKQLEEHYLIAKKGLEVCAKWIHDLLFAVYSAGFPHKPNIKFCVRDWPERNEKYQRSLDMVLSNISSVSYADLLAIKILFRNTLGLSLENEVDKLISLKNTIWHSVEKRKRAAPDDSTMYGDAERELLYQALSNFGHALERPLQHRPLIVVCGMAKKRKKAWLWVEEYFHKF